MTAAIFDTWTEKYDRWFDTPQGRFVKAYESRLLLDLLRPMPGEQILDAGCGTGIFTEDVLNQGAAVTGADLSLPMLQGAVRRTDGNAFSCTRADICALPFPDNSFDKAFSMTAIEFVADAQKVIAELGRVTVPGGIIVVTTLNRLSPWAEKRTRKAKQGHDLFRSIYFRSPDEMRALVPETAVVETAIHFSKNDPVADIPGIEETGRKDTPETGAFLAVRWCNI